MWEYLPFELQIKILEWIPIKSLIKFRSVSKPWKSIIDSSKFIADYNNRHHQILLCFPVPKYVYIIDDDDDSFFPNKSIHEVPVKNGFNNMIGSSQGLFGFYDYNYSTHDTVAVIWNPLIRKSVEILVPNVLDFPYKTELVFGVCNATDPMIVKINYIVSDDFESISSIPLQVEVFKLSTRKWISLSNTPGKSLEFCKKVVVTEGFMYWLVYDRAHAVGGLKNLILSFDLNSHEFSEISLPHSLANKPSCLELSKVGESLVLVEEHYYIDGTESSVWMMMDNSFKKLYTIKAPYGSMEKVVGFRKNGQPIIYTDSAINEQDIVVVYEPDYEHLKDIWFSVIGYPRLKCSYLYTGTLLLLDH